MWRRRGRRTRLRCWQFASAGVPKLWVMRDAHPNVHGEFSLAVVVSFVFAVQRPADVPVGPLLPRQSTGCCPCASSTDHVNCSLANLYKGRSHFKNAPPPASCLWMECKASYSPKGTMGTKTMWLSGSSGMYLVRGNDAEREKRGGEATASTDYSATYLCNLFTLLFLFCLNSEMLCMC